MQPLAVKFILLNRPLIHHKYRLFHTGLKPVRSKKELVCNFIVLQLLQRLNYSKPFPYKCLMKCSVQCLVAQFPLPLSLLLNAEHASERSVVFLVNCRIL